MKIKNFGFTLVELAVVTSILTTLLGFMTISLIRSQQRASLNSIAEVLLADLKQQQLKSMIGDTEGRLDSDSYGIHLDQIKYTLFYRTYSAGDPSNPIINLDTNMQFDNPGHDIIFVRKSGEISADSTSSAVLRDVTNGNKKTIMINRYGVITGVN